MQGLQAPGARGRLDDCIRTSDVHAARVGGADRIEASIEARVKAPPSGATAPSYRLIGDAAGVARRAARRSASSSASARRTDPLAQARHTRRRRRRTRSSGPPSRRRGSIDLRGDSRASNAELEGERALRERTGGAAPRPKASCGAAPRRARGPRRALQSAARGRALELEAQLATERGRRRNDDAPRRGGEGLVQTPAPARLDGRGPRRTAQDAAAACRARRVSRHARRTTELPPRWAPASREPGAVPPRAAARPTEAHSTAQRVAELAEQRACAGRRVRRRRWPRQRASRLGRRNQKRYSVDAPVDVRGGGCIRSTHSRKLCRPVDAADAELVAENVVVQQVSHPAVDGVALEGGGVLAEAEPPQRLCHLRRPHVQQQPHAPSAACRRRRSRRRRRAGRYRRRRARRKPARCAVRRRRAASIRRSNASICGVKPRGRVAVRRRRRRSGRRRRRPAAAARRPPCSSPRPRRAGPAAGELLRLDVGGAGAGVGSGAAAGARRRPVAEPVVPRRALRRS